MADQKEQYNGIFTISQVIEEALRNSGLEELHSVVDNISRIENLNSLITSNTSFQMKLNNINNNFENLSRMLSSASMTPELMNLSEALKANSLTAGTEYLNTFAEQWNDILRNTEHGFGIAAQNLAAIRLDPDFAAIKGLPYGSKEALNKLTKDAAEQLIISDKVKFDPRDRKFFHEDTPENKVSSDNVTVLTSAIDLFENIQESDLIKFESFLIKNPMMALQHEVGNRIKTQIESWHNLINFDMDVFYHARVMENDDPFMEQEMMSAPFNVSPQGRYNSIGVGCYYFADSLEGAVNEIKKHSGGKYKKIQIAKIKPNRNIKLLDLSSEPARTNHFAEHIRFSCDNTPGKLVKQYMLTNFVAQCCQTSHIDGIKYRSGSYYCYVTWRADYFDFIDFYFRSINA